MPKKKASSATTAKTPSTTLFLSSTSSWKSHPTWSDLKFWSGESFLSLRKRMAEAALEGSGKIVPEYKDAFKPLVDLKPSEVKVFFLNREPEAGILYHPDGYAYSDAGVYSTIADMPPRTRSLLQAWAFDPVNKHHPNPKHACLRNWSKQGVLLWNTIPFAKTGQFARFVGSGWERLTEQMLQLVYYSNPKCVFVIPEDLPPIWWKFNPDAIKIVLPKFGGWYTGQGSEPLLRMHPFSKINDLLIKNGEMPINWIIK